nr:STAS/SEC14 domain-containing protein [Pedobacter sp. ASV2]
MIEIPKDREIYEGQIATYWFSDEILVSLSKSIRRTVQNITENVALVKQITNGKRVPLLIYLKNSPVPDRETREFSTQQLPIIYSAMAMVSKPGLAQFIMKILFKFKASPIPIKSFTDDETAKEWLKQFI